ncbi:hypothetical protein MUK42_03686 [Musa troglodytarum]|uniref:Uncharacterized protein n=1 Tax=Musa troglodytarum TaxID=320322 RepID=A0A9E7GVR2_9LILI|nr:hypothetical protein MUK42_03686 [Musa troglodytarum]
MKTMWGERHFPSRARVGGAGAGVELRHRSEPGPVEREPGARGGGDADGERAVWGGEDSRGEGGGEDGDEGASAELALGAGGGGRSGGVRGGAPRRRHGDGGGSGGRWSAQAAAVEGPKGRDEAEVQRMGKGVQQGVGWWWLGTRCRRRWSGGGEEMEGRVVRWRLAARVWVSYFANAVKTGYYETRSVEWREDVDLALVAGTNDLAVIT